MEDEKGSGVYFWDGEWADVDADVGADTWLRTSKNRGLGRSVGSRLPSGVAEAVGLPWGECRLLTAHASKGRS